MGGVCDGHSMVAGEPVTTPYVRAPEAWVAEESHRPASVSFPVDCFAVGVVAACLLTGRCPWMILEASDFSQAARENNEAAPLAARWGRCAGRRRRCCYESGGS